MWDNESTFSDRQALISAGVDSENTVDAGPDDIGPGEPVVLQVNVTAGCTGTLSVQVNTSDSADMSGSRKLVEYLVATGTLAKGGTVLAAPLPSGCSRYLRLHYLGAAAGRVTAGLVQGAQTSGMR